MKTGKLVFTMYNATEYIMFYQILITISLDYIFFVTKITLELK